MIGTLWLVHTPATAAFVLAASVSADRTTSQPPVVWGRTIGSMCIDGVPGTSRHLKERRNDNGLSVEEFSVSYDYAGGAARPLLRVFRSTPTMPNPLSRCSELQGDLLFEGKVKKLRIASARETAPGAPSAMIWIGADSLQIELVHSKSGLAPLYGGSLSLGPDGAIVPSGWARLRNPQALFASTGQPTQGAVDITTWGRKLVGAKVVLPGTTASTSIDMSAGNSDVVVRVPLAGGTTELRSGVFTASAVPVAATTLSLPGSEFGNFRGTAATAKLVADTGGARFVLNDVSYRAVSTTFAAPMSHLTSDSATGLIKTIQSLASRSGPSLELRSPRVSSLSAAATACVYSYASVRVTVATQCEAGVQSAESDTVSWRFRATSSSPLLGTTAMTAKGPVTLHSMVVGQQETFGGEIADAAMALGSVELTRASVTLNVPDTTSDRIRFPFSVQVPASGGGWNLRLADGKLALTGAVRRLRARGIVDIDVKRPVDWAIIVEPGDLDFDAGVSASYEPYLYGSSPGFGSLNLALRSQSALRIAPNRSTGTIAASVAALTLSNPTFALGDRDEDFVLQGPATFSGAVRLAIPLQTGLASVDSGSLLLQNVELRSKPGRVSAVGDIRMWEAKATLDRLSATFASGHGRFEATGFSFAASRMEAKPQEGTAQAKDQFAWSGSLAAPAKVGEISGVITQDDDAREMKIDSLAVKDFSVALKDVRLGQGKALRFSGGTLEVQLSQFSDSALRGELRLRGASVKARVGASTGKIAADLPVQSLSVNLAGGTPDHPKGTASMLAGPLDATIAMELRLQKACHRGLPVRADLKTGPIGLQLAVNDGAMSGRGSAFFTTATIQSTSSYECRAENIQRTIIEEKRAKYKYPCGTTKKPFRMCKGWTVISPAVSIGFDRILEVHHLYAAGIFTETTIELPGDGDFKICGKLGQMAPLADVSYYIKPNSPIHILDSIMKEVLSVTTRLFSSEVFTGLGGLAGSIMPLTHSGLCSG